MPLDADGIWTYSHTVKANKGHIKGFKVKAVCI
jgi:hypothetical protein